MRFLDNNQKVIWIGRVVSILAILPFLPSAIMKLTSSPQVLEGMTRYGVPESLILTIGILEVLCVIIYLLPWSSVLGAILLTGYLGGTIITHLRLMEPVPIQVSLGVLLWLGLYLRDRRVRELLPLRKW